MRTLFALIQCPKFQYNARNGCSLLEVIDRIDSIFLVIDCSLCLLEMFM